MRYVTVKSHVQAGEWAEDLQWDETDWYEVAVPDDPNLRPYTLYGAEARGPSMNKRYPEGTILVFTSAIETQEESQVGKKYIVERERVDGQREATVKTLHQDDSGKHWLLPESTDPLHQQPIEVNADDGDTVRLVGRVRFAVSRE
ncbi:MAG: S24 family peptidase [bacterium]|nr:S24 family peptidase [bacterium]